MGANGTSPQGSTDEEIEACRVEPDPHGVEDRMVRRFDAEEETLIAFAIARGKRIAKRA